MAEFPEAIPLTAEEQFLHGHYVPVDSTYCVAIAFFPDRQTIGIRYDDGREGLYFPYTKEEALSLFYAPSKGRWAWTFIRQRGTKHEHVRGWAYR